MPTKSSLKHAPRPRRAKPAPGAGRRFGRTSPSAIKRPTRTPARKPKRGAAAKGGLAGLLSALPVPGAGKKASKTSAASKAKPAVAVLAAGAGALLGRKQLQKRKEEDAPVTVTPDTTGFPPGGTVPSPGAPEGGPRL